MAPPTRCIFDDYDWRSVPSNKVVVEIGNLVEKQSLSLAEHFENLRFNLQDLKDGITAAKKDWHDHSNPELQTRAAFQVLDDLASPKLEGLNVAVFLLYRSVEGWEATRREELFKRLRSHANEKTSLLVYVDPESPRERVADSMQHAGWKVQDEGDTTGTETNSVAMMGPIQGSP